MYRQIVNQLGLLGSSMIEGTALDSSFQETFPKLTLSFKDYPHSPYVLIVSDCLEQSSDFITLISGDLRITAAVSDFYVCSAASKSDNVVAGSALQKYFPADSAMNIRVISYANNTLLQKVSLLSIGSSSENLSQPLIEQASAIYVVSRIGDTSDQLSSTMKRFLEIARPCYTKLRMVAMVDSLSHLNLASVQKHVWAVSRVMRTLEAPIFHTCTLEGFGKESIEDDIAAIPIRAVLRCVVGLSLDAKRVRCHAAIVSYMKTQLPVFNRETKQAEISQNIFQLIPTIANKYNIPLSDFNCLAVNPAALGTLDFSRVRKLRDLSALTQVIKNDIPKLLQVIPHSESDLMELGYTSSATSCHPIQYGQSYNIGLYVDDFNSFNPIDGTIKGDENLKSHLQSLAGSGGASRTLHRIWRLADKDSDGRLSLCEYAVCRDLIEYAKQGGEIPKNL